MKKLKKTGAVLGSEIKCTVAFLVRQLEGISAMG
jgi:hypothetical protein